MCFTLASRGQEFHLHENQVIKDLFGLRPSSPASCRLEGTDRSNSFLSSGFCSPVSRSISVVGSMGLRQFANGSWQKIPSLAPYSCLKIVVALLSKCYVTMASDFGWLLAGSRKDAFAGGPKIKMRSSSHSRRNSSRSFFITACQIRLASRPPGGNYPALNLKPQVIPFPLSCNSTADTGPDYFVRPFCCE